MYIAENVSEDGALVNPLAYKEGNNWSLIPGYLTRIASKLTKT